MKAKIMISFFVALILFVTGCKKSKEEKIIPVKTETKIQTTTQKPTVEENINKMNENQNALTETKTITEEPLDKKDINKQDEEGRTDLMKEAENGNLVKVKELIDKGADLNIRDNQGKTALIYAVYEGHKEVVKILADKGANLDIEGRFNEKDWTPYLGVSDYTPLCVAIWKGHKEIVKILVDKGANLESYCGFSSVALMEAMAGGLPCVVSKISGNIDLIEDGKGGYVVDKKDYKCFASSISKLINNPELCHSMGDFNRKKISKYDFHNVNNELIKEYYKFEK